MITFGYTKVKSFFIIFVKIPTHLQSLHLPPKAAANLPLSPSTMPQARQTEPLMIKCFDFSSSYCIMDLGNRRGCAVPLGFVPNYFLWLSLYVRTATTVHTMLQRVVIILSKSILFTSFLWFYYNPFRVICQPFYNIFFIIFKLLYLTNNKKYIIISGKGGLVNGNRL